MFVTALCAELEERSGTVSFVNAGHCEPIVMDGDGHARLIRRSGNPPLGVMPKRTFVERNFVLAPGEMLFLYTDGMTEAPNRAGDLFNTERLLEITRQFGSRSPQESMVTVIDNVERFSAGTVQADDISCLVVRRNVTVASDRLAHHARRCLRVVVGRRACIVERPALPEAADIAPCSANAPRSLRACAPARGAF